MSLKTTEPKSLGLYYTTCTLIALFGIMFSVAAFLMETEGRDASEVYSSIGMAVASFVALFIVVFRKVMKHI